MIGRWIYHSMFDPGNILASAMFTAMLTELGRRTLWKRHFKPHMQRTREIHEKLLGGG